MDGEVLQLPLPLFVRCLRQSSLSFYGIGHQILGYYPMARQKNQKWAQLRPQLRAVRAVCEVPLVASGGAGAPQHFVDAFRDADVDAALAASVFHSGAIAIGALKSLLHENGIEVRIG